MCFKYVIIVICLELVSVCNFGMIESIAYVLLSPLYGDKRT